MNYWRSRDEREKTTHNRFSDDPKPVITECRDWYSKTQKVVFINPVRECQHDLQNIYLTVLRKASEYLGEKDTLKNKQFFAGWRKGLMDHETSVDNDYLMIDPMWCDYAEKRFYAGQLMLQLKGFLVGQDDKLNQLWNILGRELNGLMYDYISCVDLEPGEE